MKTISEKKELKEKEKQDKKAQAKLGQIVEDIVFKPNHDQVLVKSQFWTKFSSNPLVAAEDVGLETAQKFVNDPRLARWWYHSGFREWFLNEEEFAQKILALAYMALGSLEDVLTDPDGNPSAKVNAAKLAFEVANKMPQRWQKTVYLDDQIHKMDKQQLEQFIRQRSLGMGDGDGEEKS